jgi:hypothetical protein
MGLISDPNLDLLCAFAPFASLREALLSCLELGEVIVL